MNRLANLIPLLCAFSLSAQAPSGEAPPLIDGKLNDKIWQNAEKHRDFSPMADSNRDKVSVHTEFMVRHDSENVYFGIYCEEPRMKELKRVGNLWYVDGVELFLNPTGGDDEYYQFLVTAGGEKYCMYYAESGNIRPDPFAPDWEAGTNLGADGWSVEIKIPLRSLYMTPSARWSERWRFNLARNRRLAQENITWSKLRGGFHEPSSFRFLTGMPRKPSIFDLKIQSADARIIEEQNGKLKGALEIAITAGEQAAGKYRLTAITEDGKSYNLPIDLKAGRNTVTLPEVDFGAPGTRPVECSLTRDGRCFAKRSYPVFAEYRPLKLHLSAPAYRDNFYPGQNSDRIAGTAELQLPASELKQAKIELTLSGPGIRTQHKSIVPGSLHPEFIFDVPGLPVGVYELAARLTTGNRPVASEKRTLRKLSPPEGIRHPGWIENSSYVLDGRKMFPKFIYAPYYQGGAAFRGRYDSDDLGFDFRGQPMVTLEPGRLVPGIETKEATRDVKPSPEVFRKLLEWVKASEKKDFYFYYLSDEPECRRISPVYLRHLYEAVKEQAPYHPVVIVSRGAGRYVDAADIIIPHPYIAPSSDGKGGRFLNIPIAKVRDYVRAVSRQGRPDKMTGLTPQFFSYRSTSAYADYPTWEENEASFYSMIANGGRFFYPYAYHDLGDRGNLYELARWLNAGVSALAPLLCSSRELPLKITGDTSTLDAVLLEGNGQFLLLLVNLIDRPNTVRVESGKLSEIGLWHGFRTGKNLRCTDGSVSLAMEPYECRVLTSVPLDKGLPDREKGRSAADAMEKNRRSSPSILFEKGLQLEINSSVPSSRIMGIQNKLFDGVRDVLAWSHTDSKTAPMLEFIFPKFVPEFSKIRIYGTPLPKEVKLSIFKAGEWISQTPSSVKTDPYMLEFDYGKKLRTIKMRLDFPVLKPGQIQEVYEVELIP